MQVTDEWLYEKMPIVDEAIIQKLERETDYEYAFSDTFDRQMARLLRREKYIKQIQCLKNVSRRVAMFALVFVIAFFSVTMSADAYRVRFFTTIKTVLEDRTGIYSYQSVDEVQSKVDKMAVPQYVPAGYQLEDTRQSDRVVLYEYQSGEKTLLFQQKRVVDKTELYDESYDQMERISVNGVDVQIYRYADGTFWSYAEYKNSVYILSGDAIEAEDIKKIYEKWAF